MLNHSNTSVYTDDISLEYQFGAHNYKPVPVVISRGEGVFVWDTEGKRYYDFLSAYSALNQGHRHPRLLKIAHEQLEQVTLTSRAFYNDKLGIAEQFLCETFGFDKSIMMNSGVEAVETALKLARRWAYDVKGIAENEAVIVAAKHNFHGRTLGAISFSTDASSKRAFGPFLPGVEVINYNDIEALEKSFQSGKVCAFLVEPIQGEAGIIVPDDGYLSKVRELCTRYNVLMLADEIQTGLGRTGKMLCCDYENVKPDVLILGKALSGGFSPVSAVLCNDEIMFTIKPGEHGSTFGGNPFAAAIAVEAIKVIQEEHLAENAYELGFHFRERLKAIDSPLIKTVRGKGLFNAIEFNFPEESSKGYELCIALKNNGLLAKDTHGNIIRFAPPLLITKAQVEECCDKIEKTILAF